MTAKEKVLLFVSMAVVAVLLFMEQSNNYLNILRSFIPSVEGFRSKPYWDVSQWTWGYGTRVPGSISNKNVVPNKTITKSQAFDEMISDLNTRYNYLSKLITAPLNAKQWAAYLSFAYNEGVGNADNLVKNINNKDLAALEYQWKQYNKVKTASGGYVVSSDLVDRRAKEWQLFIS